MEKTANYNLSKPGYEDGADIAILNQNMDAIDAEFKNLQDNKAPLASPALTGTPTAPTATADTSTTQLATTAFVTGQASTTDPGMDGTAAVGTSKKFARSDHVHPTDTSRAPLASPGLTGIPTAPTAAADTSTTQLATTAFVTGQASATAPGMDGTAAVGTSKKFARSDHIHPTDTSRAPVDSPALTGTPTAPTAIDGTNTTQLATTKFVAKAIANLVASSPEALNTLYELAAALGNDPNFATTVSNQIGTKSPINSPTFTGTPAAPTAAVDTSTTQLATTAFVTGQASATAPGMDGAAAVGTSKKYARSDHVHPTDTSRAPLISPALTGTPTAPTAAADTSTTQVATTAFVTGQASITAPSMDGTAAIGSSKRYARADHTHPSDTSRVSSDTLHNLGLGSNSLVNITDPLDTNLVNGIYWLDSQTSGVTNLPPSWAVGFVQVMADGDCRVVRAIGMSNLGSYNMEWINKYMHDASAGSPLVWKGWYTDEIQHGGNENGYYTKYPDGTMECWIKTQITTGATYGDWEWAFPASFISTDDLVVSEPISNFSDIGIPIDVCINMLNVYNVQFLFYNNGGGARLTDKVITISVRAIGHWK